jgi:hypothetical protein
LPYSNRENKGGEGLERLAAGVIVLMFLLVLPMTGFACKCVEKSPELLFEEADAVFKGSVVDANEYSTMAAVNVMEIWKGTNKDGVYVYTDSSSCSYRFEVDREYIFYAGKEKGKFVVTTCTGTFALDERSEERSLGKGVPPSEHVTLKITEEEVTEKKWGVIGFIVLGVGCLFLILLSVEKRMKKR